MHRGPSGTYLKQPSGSDAFQAFCPASLPPDPPLVFSPKRRKLLERATLALGRLDSITLLLPDPDIFLYAYVRREAILSSQIEGTQSSLSDLFLFEVEEFSADSLDDITEVSNYVKALNYGITRMADGFPLSNRLLREMHAILLADGRGSDKQPGQFRTSQNWIGGTRPGTAHYVPPPPYLVEESMSNLEKFLHDETQPYQTLIKAGIAHVQFETIHPFLDGNGRLGRMLIAFILHHEGQLKHPLLYLSLYFKQHRERYYELLDIVRHEGDWEAWIDFFLTGVEVTAGNAVETARNLVNIFRDDGKSLQHLGARSGSVLRVYQAFCQRPINSIGGAKDFTDLSYPAVAAAVESLVTLGILKEITGRKRNRLYMYSDYIKALETGIGETEAQE